MSAKKKILVVDDEELLIKSMNRLLEKQGYQVYSTKSSADAEILMEEEVFDLVICDIRMPGKSGVELMETARKKRPVPVIFITGFADPDSEAAARRLEPAAYIFKPFDVQEIFEAVKKVLGPA